MKRSTKIALGAVVMVAALATAAVAVSWFRLRGSGSVTGFDGTATLMTLVSDDAGTSLDPQATPGVGVGYTRAAYHLGTTTVTGTNLPAGSWTFTATNAYEDYVIPFYVEAKANSANLVLQGVEVVPPVPGFDGWLEEGKCGLAMPVGIAQGFIAGAVVAGTPSTAPTAVTVEVELVPSTVFDAGLCP
jgi:hypothetical protein